MRFAERWWQGLQRRLSRRDAVLRLGLRTLYIVPSSFGGLWLLSGGVLYVVGINSRSNGPVLLALLQLGLMLLSLFLTHLNLQGLELRCVEAAPSCADEPAAVPLLALSRQSRAGVKLRWLSPHEPAQAQQLVHLPAGTTSLTVPWRPPCRGLQQPGRLLVQTTAPLGLFRCWAYWEPPLMLAIAPARRAGPVQEVRRPSRHDPSAALQGGHGSDHFEELRPLRPQEGLQRVAWKPLARGQGWYGKHFSAEQTAALWLAPAAGLPGELALEHLCERLCRGLAAGERLGLLLPNGIAIAPASGPAQQRRCLQALAAAPA